MGQLVTVLVGFLLVTVSLSQLLEDSFQIAWDYLERSGKLGDGTPETRIAQTAR